MLSITMDHAAPLDPTLYSLQTNPIRCVISLWCLHSLFMSLLDPVMMVKDLWL